MTRIYCTYDSFYEGPGVSIIEASLAVAPSRDFYLIHPHGIRYRKRYMMAMDFIDDPQIKTILSDSKPSHIQIDYFPTL